MVKEITGSSDWNQSFSGVLGLYPPSEYQIADENLVCNLMVNSLDFGPRIDNYVFSLYITSWDFQGSVNMNASYGQRDELTIGTYYPLVN